MNATPANQLTGLAQFNTTENLRTFLRNNNIANVGTSNIETYAIGYPLCPDSLKFLYFRRVKQNLTQEDTNLFTNGNLPETAQSFAAEVFDKIKPVSTNQPPAFIPRPEGAGEIIPIAFAANIAYYPPLGVFLTSLLHNNPNERFAFHVMTDVANVPEQDKIRSIAEKYPNFDIRFIVMDNRRFEHLPPFAGGIQTYYRFLLPELFPKLDKILYLDADMVCNGSIQELWLTDIGNKYAGGCVDPGTTSEGSRFYPNFWTNRKQLIGQSAGHIYVNAGVLVLNLKQIRRDKKVPELFEFYKNSKHLALPGISDQDAINYVFRGKVHRFDGRYNFQWGDSLFLMHRCQQGNGSVTMSNPAIAHFTGDKPWGNNCSHLFSFLWHQYAKMYFGEDVKIDSPAPLVPGLNNTAILTTRSELITKYFPKHSTGMEIGVFRGEFASFLFDTLQPKHLYLVDPFEPVSVYSGDKDGLNGVTVPNLRKYYLDNLVPKFGALPNVSLIPDFSFNVLQQIPDGSLDWIYIDGDHSYEGCRKDLTLAKQKVKSGGIIAGHDYCPEFGVMKAVDEFCQEHSYSIEVLTKDGCPSWLIRNGEATFCERVENPQHFGTLSADRKSEFSDAVSIVKSNTMVCHEGLQTAWNLVRQADETRLQGAIVECGVWKGGCTGLMALAHLRSGEPKREIHLFDSFEGIPVPELKTDGHSAVEYYDYHKSNPAASPHGLCIAPIDEVKALLEDRIEYPKDKLIYHKGWFKDTMPVDTKTMPPIAVLRLDGDWYESTKTCLENLYDKVVPGGFIMLDDYGWWEGCKKATDEFLGKLPVKKPVLYRAKHTAYFVKPEDRQFFGGQTMIHPTVKIDKFADVQKATQPQSVLSIGAGGVISNFCTIRSINAEKSICIGNGFYLSEGCTMIGVNGIHIGDHVMVGPNCSFAAFNHGYKDKKIPMLFQAYGNKGGILIEDDVWIGANCAILDGSIIRRGSIIGAGSLVRGEIPPYTIWAGNPLKKIGERTDAQSISETNEQILKAG